MARPNLWQPLRIARGSGISAAIGVASVTATILRDVASFPGFVSAAYAEPFQYGSVI